MLKHSSAHEEMYVKSLLHCEKPRWTLLTCKREQEPDDRHKLHQIVGDGLVIHL